MNKQSLNDQLNQNYLKGLYQAYKFGGLGASATIATDIVLPSGNIKSDLINGLIFSSIGAMLLKTCAAYLKTITDFKGCLTRASDAEMNLYNRHLIRKASQLARKQPVISPPL